jgi:hypothetical protein
LLFNELGRNIPSVNCRVFSTEPKNFYKIDAFDTNYSKQHELALENNFLSEKVNVIEAEENLTEIKNLIINDNIYKNLFKGTAIPFCMSVPDLKKDIGTILEDYWLPLLKKEYEKKVPGTYFKATLQGNIELKNSLSISENSGYDIFLNNCSESTVLGYFFPTAFQEFDIESQRRRISVLPKISNLSLSLSGPFEIIYSLISYPQLLYSKNNYSPILCASALKHIDPRMVMLFKSYGQNLEFWLMTQMLTPTKTQVSEQWSGGITIFKSI